MQADWSVECGAQDPVLVVPWSDPSGAAAFVDLHAHPHAIDTIREAEAHPPLMQALRALNGRRSPVFTAKCDAWEMGDDELKQLRVDLGFDPQRGMESDIDTVSRAADAEPCFGFAGYIDLICRDRALFASFPRHEQLLQRIARLAAPLGHPHATLESVLRPAFLHLDRPGQGYAISIYVKALEMSASGANAAWAAALSDVVALLRRSEIVR